MVGVMPYGIDVSENQGQIDWCRVKGAGIAFAVARCVTEPDTIDPTYAHNVAGARVAGIVPGAYCFLSGGTARAQAAKFIATVGNPSGMLIMLDVERPTYHAVPTAADVRAFGAIWHNAHPAHPLLVYGSRGSILGSLGNLASVGPLWLAAYPSTLPGAPASLYAAAGGPGAREWKTAFGGWTHPLIWQYASTGRVPGISKPVDLDVIHLADLARLAPK